VVIAFDCGNLLQVAKTIREKYQDTDLIFCADDDTWTEGNPGKRRATDAARAVGGRVVLPVFGSDRAKGQTDFNDLHMAEGLEAVRLCIEAKP
jgi:putative DNA primase/helicase